MKVHLKIFLPALPEAIGDNELEVEFSGATVNDLIESLVERYGQKARQALYDEKGKFDPLVQVLLNGEEWVTYDRLNKGLNEGDQLVFMIMMAGG
ncbi:MAG: MoaD/ThiS family protein [Desulfobacteraceae bacterium]|nr:MoaD/ThiS family protein [Desulfobacteraceae bacterium]